MKKILYCLTAISLFSCNDSSSEKTEETRIEPTTNTQSMLTEDEKKDGWQSLFDGTTTKGWHKYGGSGMNNGWKVSDNSLQFDASLKTDTSAKTGKPVQARRLVQW